MPKPTLLALTPGHPGQIESLEQDFGIIKLWKERDPETTLHENASRIEAVTTFLAPVTERLIQILPNLKIIAVGAVGLDHIDLKAAKARGIQITNTPDVLTNDVADLALGLILSLSRRIVEGDAFIRAGLWKSQTFPLGISLTGKTLGIVGLGRIGKAIAGRAHAFGLKISYTGRNAQTQLPYEYFPNLKDLAARSDYLLLSCKGGEETKGLVDLPILKALGPKGFLINVSRGAVVSEQDLLVALRNKDIAGAALDVYEKEPDVPESLFSMDNVILAPHIGSATQEGRYNMGQVVVRNLLSWKAGKTLPDVVEYQV